MGLLRKIFTNVSSKPVRAKVMRDLIEPGSTEQFVLVDNIVTKTGNGEDVEVEAVTMDSMPNGSDKTVVAIHGAPGSHQDYKYFLPFCQRNNYRLLAINFPGFGETKHNDKFTFSNGERLNYIQNVLTARNVKSSDKLIFMGHSRGGINALGAAINYLSNTVGVVLVNSVGIRNHRGIKPHFPISIGSKLWELFPRARNPILYPFFYRLYQTIGLKTPNGLISMNCLRTINSFDLPSQLPMIDIINQSDLKILQLNSGKDWLIEKEVVMEFAGLMNDMKYITSTKLDDDSEVIKKVEEYFNNGNKHLSVYFELEGHFLNQFRARVITEAIKNIFDTSANIKAKL
uniref:AB hydrolase-1 domain-containing protein n=1 Tax=Rhabditophanes sp. KR3021 TaxID=114890 RepID=A0AC35TPR5_9BILA